MFGNGRGGGREPGSVLAGGCTVAPAKHLERAVRCGLRLLGANAGAVSLARCESIQSPL